MKTTNVTVYFTGRKTISVLHEDDTEINHIKDDAVRNFHEIMKDVSPDRIEITDVDEEW